MIGRSSVAPFLKMNLTSMTVEFETIEVASLRD